MIKKIIVFILEYQIIDLITTLTTDSAYYCPKILISLSGVLILPCYYYFVNKITTLLLIISISIIIITSFVLATTATRIAAALIAMMIILIMAIIIKNYKKKNSISTFKSKVSRQLDYKTNS
jgi:hypothetical protein